MGEIGEVLKKAREKKGLTLRDAEDVTKIRYKYLEALEEENFTVIPGDVYTKGFIRSYGNYLDLDGDALLNTYKEAHGKPEEHVKEEINNEPSGENLKPRYWVYALILAAVLALILFALLKSSNSGQEPSKNPAKSKISGNVTKPKTKSSPTPAPKENVTPTPQVTPAPQQIQGVKVDLAVTGKECWVRVEVDGKFNYQAIIPAGTTKSFQGQKSVRVRLGNAPDVNVTVNGQNKGTIGGGKRVVTQEFTAP